VYKRQEFQLATTQLGPTAQAAHPLAAVGLSTPYKREHGRSAISVRG